MNQDYKEEVLDHYHYPRNVGSLSDPDVDVEEINVSCGDKIKLQITCQKDKIKEVKYQCHACAIATAASSMISELVKGKTLKSISKLSLRDIEKLFGCSINPGRVKCATLGLNTLKKAIKDYESKQKNSDQQK
jgi:nitrogen fixation NifU-like protein